MTAIFDKITACKRGTIHYVGFRTLIPTKDGRTIEKRTYGLYRVGVNYSHMTSVIAKGLGGNPLPGNDKWAVYPFAIESEKGIKIRLYNTFNPFAYHKTEFFLDGVETTREALMESGIVAPSKIAKRGGVLDTFTVFLDNIIEFR